MHFSPAALVVSLRTSRTEYKPSRYSQLPVGQIRCCALAGREKGGKDVAAEAQKGTGILIHYLLFSGTGTAAVPSRYTRTIEEP